MSACLAATAAAAENELVIGKFSSGDATGWKTQTISISKPKTVYTLTGLDNHRFLRANSTKSASGLIYKFDHLPKDFQTLKWSWKIDRINIKADERQKSGEDFAVRVYAIFPRGVFSSKRAICYVWANKLPKGSHVRSPFSDSIITVAVDSGSALAGQWVFHQRNLRDDYRKFFGEEPPALGAIAIMTDSDNTGETSVGYYGDISLARNTAKASIAREKNEKTKGSAAPAKSSNGKS